MPTPTPPDYLKGLSEAEATARLKQEGYNELPATKKRSIFTIALEVVREPMFLLLVAAGIIYLALGDVREAMMLLAFVFVVIGITIYQEQKTERVLEALRDLTSPRALVVRDGEQRRIPGREVVRGDTLMLAEGDRVPADVVLLSCNDLLADESLLTGESVPVRKTRWDGIMQMAHPGGDDLPFAYSGTLLVQGQGVAQVLRTGVRSEIGKIGKALQMVEPEPTPLQKQTGHLVRNFAIVGIVLCILVVVLYGLTRGSWLNGLLTGITLAMSILPEEFSVVLTVFLALGAWRISQQQVLPRRVPAVETLGAATVLCVDKTGTLTQNRMTVNTLFADNAFYAVNYDDASQALPEDFHELVEFSILASEIEPFDPMEKAFRRLGEHYLANTEHLHDNWTIVHEYSLSPEMLAMSHVWKATGRDEFVVAAKGAPEAIADLCHLDSLKLRALSDRVNVMAGQGLRVLAMAKATFRGAAWPPIQHDFDFEFIGLIGLADPLRPTVPNAIKECLSAGIRVVMITGDYAGTASAIAREAGLGAEGEIITGDELGQLSDAKLQARIQNATVFARVVPEQKLRLVNAFKANGEVVAMTGDGVNDAPALKAAHIGVSMGGRGTDVAREASSLVLLDDDFASIVHAVRLGRRIFDNLKKAMSYILAAHVPIAGLTLFPLIMGWPLILAPIHIVFLEMIINPACSIVFEAEPEEDNIMNRPPRSTQQPLFGGWTLGLSLLQGISVLLIVLAVYAVSLQRGQGEAESRTLAFTTLVIANLSLILTNRSWNRSMLQMIFTPNPALWWVVGGTAVFLGLVLYVPVLVSMFHFATLHLNDLALCFGAGLGSVMWFEALKKINGKSGKKI